MEGLEPEPDVNQDLSSAQWQAPPYLGWGCVPNCWSRSPVHHVQLTPVPLSVLSSSTALAPLPQRGAVLEQEQLTDTGAYHELEYRQQFDVPSTSQS